MFPPSKMLILLGGNIIFLYHSFLKINLKDLGVIARIKHCLPNYILLNLYYTLIFPYLSYCNIVWGIGAVTIKLTLNNYLLYEENC